MVRRDPRALIENAARELEVISELHAVLRSGNRGAMEAAFKLFCEAAERKHTELALRLHPDRPGGDLERMQRVNAARDVVRSIELNPVARPVRRVARVQVVSYMVQHGIWSSDSTTTGGGTGSGSRWGWYNTI